MEVYLAAAALGAAGPRRLKRGRCVQCRRRLGSKAVHLYDRPDGSAAYLCGRRACEIAYNGGRAELCDCGAHRKAGA